MKRKKTPGNFLAIGGVLLIALAALFMGCSDPDSPPPPPPAEETWTVKFYDADDVQMGDAVSVAKSPAQAVPAASIPSTAVAGKDFKGWYTNKARTTAWDSTSNVTGDLDIYGKWESVQQLRPILGGITWYGDTPLRTKTTFSFTQDEVYEIEVQGVGGFNFGFHNGTEFVNFTGERLSDENNGWWDDGQGQDKDGIGVFGLGGDSFIREAGTDAITVDWHTLVIRVTVTETGNYYIRGKASWANLLINYIGIRKVEDGSVTGKNLFPDLGTSKATSPFEMVIEGAGAEWKWGYSGHEGSFEGGEGETIYYAIPYVSNAPAVPSWVNDR
jgi:hypothetical protein